MPSSSTFTRRSKPACRMYVPRHPLDGPRLAGAMTREYVASLTPARVPVAPPQINNRKAQEMEDFADWQRKVRSQDTRDRESILSNFKRQAAVMMQRAWRHYRGWKGLLRLVREVRGVCRVPGRQVSVGDVR